MKHSATHDARHGRHGRALLCPSKDYVEGRTAFMEKRKPVFTGT